MTPNTLDDLKRRNEAFVAQISAASIGPDDGEEADPAVLADALFLGVAIFDALIASQSDPLAPGDEFAGERLDRDVLELLRAWISPVQLAEASIDRFRERGVDLPHADRFHAACALGEWIVHRADDAAARDRARGAELLTLA